MVLSTRRLTIVSDGLRSVACRWIFYAFLNAHLYNFGTQMWGMIVSSQQTFQMQEKRYGPIFKHILVEPARSSSVVKRSSMPIKRPKNSYTTYDGNNSRFALLKTIKKWPIYCSFDVYDVFQTPLTYVGKASAWIVRQIRQYVERRNSAEWNLQVFHVFPDCFPRY